ncbi:MAG: acyltransferase [Deltaproteobacteria bacterium]|nr:acyltransferase [Deltaproteobacteria bacterium]
MRRDHRPYIIKKLYLKFQQWYGKYFLQPQLRHLGKGAIFMKPWHVEIFGWPVEIGDYANIIASYDKKVRLTIWSSNNGNASIHIGNHCLICPGVRISAGSKITIGDNCMMAHNSYISDCDWHDTYNRITSGKALPVRIGNNVWIADSAIICKGVTIGDNSIVGAGAVVTKDIPINSVAAGNPAVVVKKLDPNIEMKTRADWFSNPERLMAQIDNIDRDFLGSNTLLGWLRSLVFPKKGD